MASWFRRTLLREAQAAEKAPAPDAREEVGPETVGPEAREALPEPESSDAPAKPRRRGSRGGSGRTKTDAAVSAEDAAPPETPKRARSAPAKAATAKGRKPADAPAKEPAARKATAAKPAAAKADGPKRRRRGETPRRSSLPALRKQMLISIDVGEQRVAVLEDDQVVEVYLERPGRRSIAGNIYKGVVDNVLPGMEASFVEIGLEKNGFLYVDEIVVPELEGKRHGRRIQDIISRGQEVIVQATKDPMGTKGARLTTEVSLPGRFIVYTPYGDGIGVSRRLDDDERDRLKGICKGLELPEGGIIVRTAAEGASDAELAGDLAFLQKLWSTVQGRASRATAPTLVYREAELPLRVVRDLFTDDFEGLGRRARTDLPSHRELPQADVPGARLEGRVASGSRASHGDLRGRRRRPLDARAPRRPAVRRLPRVRLRGGVHRHRREHRPLRRRPRQDLRRPARGHDHEEQPRGREGDRASAAPPRHRGHHRHRLHRHGEPEEPPGGGGGAATRARARSHQDIRGRDLAARPRRDDPAERHGRSARDPDRRAARFARATA